MATKYASRAFAFSIVFLAVGCGKGECRNDDDCDDGLFCNGNETCENSQCRGGRDPTCDDQNDDTEDWCDEDIHDCRHGCLDIDGDGHLSDTCGGDDCDETDEGIYGGAPERCNGLDDDCNGAIDEDRDHDGWYNDEGVCSDLDPEEVDCDDDDPSVHPGAAEPCDDPPKDNNCVNGTDDEEDTDGDGHVESGCPSSPGGDDCDDEDESIHPGADEVCNGFDDDCDGTCDNEFDCCVGEEVDCITVCDSIGTGPCAVTCSPPEPADCTPPAEICNGEDDDCDDLVDNDLPCTPGEVADCETVCGTTGRGVCTDECQPAPPEACNPPDEDCNGEDDDCDDVVDDGFDCVPGDIVDCTTTCGTSSVGLCTSDCEPPSESACTPATELNCMDFEDNDCDGDEDCTDEDCFLDPWCG